MIYQCTLCEKYHESTTYYTITSMDTTRICPECAYEYKAHKLVSKTNEIDEDTFMFLLLFKNSSTKSVFTLLSPHAIYNFVSEEYSKPLRPVLSFSLPYPEYVDEYAVRDALIQALYKHSPLEFKPAIDVHRFTNKHDIEAYLNQHAYIYYSKNACPHSLSHFNEEVFKKTSEIVHDVSKNAQVEVL